MHRSLFVPVALLMGVLLGLPACNVNIDLGRAKHRETRDNSFDFPLGGSLEVVTKNGSVDIREARTDGKIRVTAHIKATSEERLAETVILADALPDGTLSISASWPGQRESSEGCSFVIETPRAAKVRVRSGNGAISLDDMSGPADLETSNGRITVKDHDGPVEARTSNGRVTLEDIAGLIVVRTSNGRVEIEDAEATVDASTSNGRITIELDDDNRGPVKAQTSNGRIKLKVGDDFCGDVSMRSSSHSKIRFDDIRGANVLERTRSSAKIHIPGGEHHSELVSSNGSITLERD